MGCNGSKIVVYCGKLFKISIIQVVPVRGDPIIIIESFSLNPFRKIILSNNFIKNVRIDLIFITKHSTLLDDFYYCTNKKNIGVVTHAIHTCLTELLKKEEIFY